LTLFRLSPTYESFVGLSAEEQSWLIASEYGICNGLRANFVIDTAGQSFGAKGDSSDISNHVDRLLLGKLRSLADVIVTSGKTARTERYKSSKHAPIAIFTQSGDLDSVPAVQGTQYFTPLVLTPVECLAQVESNLSDVDVRFVTLEATQDDTLWPAKVAHALHHEGFQSPILESGLSTIRQFLESSVLDELCLTITASAKHRLSARNLSNHFLDQLFGNFGDFQLKNLFVTDGTSFSRWVRNGVADQS
jgi:riboflavin biosynthesis pyrimidine reductase